MVKVASSGICLHHHEIISPVAGFNFKSSWTWLSAFLKHSKSLRCARHLQLEIQSLTQTFLWFKRRPIRDGQSPRTGSARCIISLWWHESVSATLGSELKTYEYFWIHLNTMIVVCCVSFCRDPVPLTVLVHLSNSRDHGHHQVVPSPRRFHPGPRWRLLESQSRSGSHVASGNMGGPFLCFPGNGQFFSRAEKPRYMKISRPQNLGDHSLIQPWSQELGHGPRGESWKWHQT